MSAINSAGSGLGLVAAGLVALCVADSGFAYLTAIGRYATGSPVDAGWFGGFLLIAAAARSATHTDEQIAAAAARESTISALLPYAFTQPAVIGRQVVSLQAALVSPNSPPTPPPSARLNFSTAPTPLCITRNAPAKAPPSPGHRS